MLLVYCFQSVDVAAYPHGLPSLLAALAVVALHQVETQHAALHRRRHAAATWCSSSGSLPADAF